MKNIARIICVAFVLIVQMGYSQTLVWDSLPGLPWVEGTLIDTLSVPNTCNNYYPFCNQDVCLLLQHTGSGLECKDTIDVWFGMYIYDPTDYYVFTKPSTSCHNGIYLGRHTFISETIYGPIEENSACTNYSNANSIGNSNLTSAISSSNGVSVSSPGFYLIKYTIYMNACESCEFFQVHNVGCENPELVNSSVNENTYQWMDDNSIRLNQPYPSCEENLGICSDTTLFFGFDYTSNGINPNCGNTSQEMWYGFYVDDPNDFDFIIQPVTNAPASWTVGISHLDIYGPVDPSYPCNALECSKSSHIDLDSTTTTYNYNDVVSTITTPGYYLLNAVFVDNNPAINVLCQGYYGVTTQNLGCAPSTSDFTIEEGSGEELMSNECESCIPEMVPEEGKKYVVSAWVSEANSNFGTITYSAPEILVKFIGPNSDISITCTTEHPIIDGWQLMEAEITIPAGTTQIELQLKSNGVDSYFDDVRFFPYDGSMKSYVYDPKNLRFVAELDERHFATLYEYDEEGRLMRIKKETERGIMTIQESKSSNVKKNGVEGDE
jgi:hypothetical protein